MLDLDPRRQASAAAQADYARQKAERFRQEAAACDAVARMIERTWLLPCGVCGSTVSDHACGPSNAR